MKTEDITSFRHIVRNVPQKRGKGRPAGSCNKPKDIAPTPETAAKHIPYAVRALDPELQRAAVLICKAYWRLCGKLMCRASNLSPQSPGKPAEFSGPILILILRYQAWMTEATRRRLHTESLIDMIVDGHTPEQCDRFHRFLPGSSAATLRTGLKLYTQTRVQRLEAKLAETGDQFALTGRAV